MRGIELILMGITALQNRTNYNDGKPPEIDGVLDMSKLDVSAADYNLRGRSHKLPSEITVTTWQNMPYSGLTCAHGKCTGHGYAFDILHLIQSKLNFTYTIIPPDKMMLGDENTGVMGLLYHKKVDLAVAFIPMLPDLNNLCTFSSIMDRVEITLMMKRPRESATGSGLLAPFHNRVWICILISLLVVGPTIYILILIRSKISRQEQQERYTLATCMWFAYGALLKQGSTSAPNADSTRLLFATWWIFITILTSFYTANLTAFLTLSEFTLPYKNIPDIVNKHQKWFSLEKQTVDETLKTSHTGTLEDLRISIARDEGIFIPLTGDYHLILDYVDRGRIFLGERHYMESIIFNDYGAKTNDDIEESARCTYVMLPDNIYVMNRAFAYPRKSPMARLFNPYLRNLMETGIVKYLRKQDLPSVKICPLNLKSKERRLRNSDLTMTYQVVGFGFTIATGVFLGEIIYTFIRMTKRRFKCGKCCSRLCCRTKLKSAELPVYSVNPHPEVLKQMQIPVYESRYNQQLAEKHFINGRDYWVITEKDGDRRLVPIRTPSALLFSYTT